MADDLVVDGGYIHKDPLPGLVYAQFFPLFIYMGNHHMGVFNGVRLHVPHTAIHFLEIFGYIIVKYRSTRRGKCNAKYGVHTRCHKLMPDTYGLFPHPFRSASCNRPFADIVAKTACFDHLCRCKENTAVIDT